MILSKVSLAYERVFINSENRTLVLSVGMRMRVSPLRKSIGADAISLFYQYISQHYDIKTDHNVWEIDRGPIAEDCYYEMKDPYDLSTNETLRCRCNLLAVSNEAKLYCGLLL
jgi:hypothetical protein